MKGRTACSVHGCNNVLVAHANLCSQHFVPAVVLRVGDSEMVVSSWLVRRGEEIGLILLNDFALGDIHGGTEGFVAHLESQGFSEIRLLQRPEDLESAKQLPLAAWTGPWLTQYPWQRKTYKMSDLAALIQTNVCDETKENYLMALIYADGVVRIKYPYGNPTDFNVGESDDGVQLAEKQIRKYCNEVIRQQPEIEVHRHQLAILKLLIETFSHERGIQLTCSSRWGRKLPFRYVNRSRRTRESPPWEIHPFR